MPECGPPVVLTHSVQTVRIRVPSGPFVECFRLSLGFSTESVRYLKGLKWHLGLGCSPVVKSLTNAYNLQCLEKKEEIIKTKNDIFNTV